MSTTDRVADRLRRSLVGVGASVTRSGDERVEVSGALSQPERRVEVYVRGDSDFDVAFHVPEKRGSPFEQVFAGPPEDAENLQACLVTFVADLVVERVIVAMDGRFFRGGRQFVTVSRVSEPASGDWAWVASWRGTYDRDRGAS